MPYADPAKNRECIKRYRKAHKDELNARVRQLRAANPEQFKEYTRRYKAKLDPEVRRKRKHEAYLRRKEKHIMECKRWLNRNRERANQNQRIYKKKHPEIGSNDRDKRRARIRNSTIGNIDIIKKWERLWRAKRTVFCYWCKKRFRPSRCVKDHIISISRNGSHSIDNLCISCRMCNAQKHAKSISDWNLWINEPSLI